MNVKELIKELSNYPPEAEVLITDGYAARCYRGDYKITMWENRVDIGIDGCSEDNEDSDAV